jgi:hypothetical protein
MTENQFRYLFEHGIFEHVRLVQVPKVGTAIEYMLSGGEVGMIDTELVFAFGVFLVIGLGLVFDGQGADGYTSVRRSRPWYYHQILCHF